MAGQTSTITISAEDDHRPLILIHRNPSFQSPQLTGLLRRHFRLLDLNENSSSPPLSLDAFLSLHAPRPSSPRALVVFGLRPLTADTIRLLPPSLRLVVGTTAGTNHIDVDACRRRGIAVTGIGNAFTDVVAEYAVGMLIDVLRRVSAANRYVRAGLWRRGGDYALGFKVGGKRVGIMGLGKIGSAIAQFLTPFGCKISYTSRKEKPWVPFPYYANVLHLASESDVLVVCCALTEATRHIINKDVIRALGKEGVIINVGRGALIDEKEMVRALTQGELGGAGLDVFENEPDVPKELFDLDNVVLSPHAAVVTPESLESSSQVVLANLQAFYSNKPLVSPIIEQDSS